MSGRSHIFMLPEQEAKLKELVKTLGIEGEKFGVSHAISTSLNWLIEQEKAGLLTDEQLKYIKDVPSPPNYGHLHVFLRQVNVDALFKLLYKWGIQTYDYAFSHVLTTAFCWVLEQIKANTANERLLHDLKNVKPPKIVLHN